MANRVSSTLRHADNNAGKLHSAAVSDWRRGAADSMSARANKSPQQMPDIRLQATPLRPSLSITHRLRGKSIYDLLGGSIPKASGTFVKVLHRTEL